MNLDSIMLDRFYENLLSDQTSNQASEAAPPSYVLFTERHLQAIWLDQKYFRNLETIDNQPIHVISPGIWNMEAGPDFRKAHLRIGDREIKGDIEIHLNEGDWYNHQHHIDSRYQQVVLHLILWKPKKNKPSLTCTGKSILQVHLESYLTIPLARIVQLIDLDLYPYKKFVGSGQCARALYRSLPEKEIASLFHSATEYRLKQKYLYLSSMQVEQSLQCATGISLALGYKNNAEPFLNLFLYLLNYRHYNQEELLALSLGICNFFTPRYHTQWEKSSYYQRLYFLWKKLNPDKHPKITLLLNQIRPLNHPVRRFAYLSYLLSDTRTETLYPLLESCWNDLWKGSSPSILKRELCKAIPSYTDMHWNCHYNFESEKRLDFLPLIGMDFKEEILINTFSPLLLEKIKQRKNPEEYSAFNHFYTSFPASKNSKAKYLAHRFFGESSKRSLLNKAYMEQGAFQLHRDFCTHFEASCEGCSFVENYKNQLTSLGASNGYYNPN